MHVFTLGERRSLAHKVMKAPPAWMVVFVYPEGACKLQKRKLFLQFYFKNNASPVARFIDCVQFSTKQQCYFTE